MPRSRSRSIESSTCASISRAWSAPVISRKRSASVDLPWSIWAMTEKLRMKRWSIGAKDDSIAVGERAGHARPYTLPLIDRKKALRVLRPDVIRPGSNQPVVRVLLEDVGGPAGNPADGEDRRVEVDRDAQRIEHRRGVEVDVRI